MEQSKNEQHPLELSSQLVAIMTTEHYSLQTGRSMTIAEVNGRASLVVGAVSSGLIALAFVGQISRLGTAFYVFSLVVLPTLFLMGLITFERVLQADMADSIYTRGINRMIAVLNSVLAGSFGGLLLAVFALPLWVCTSAGVVAFLVSVGIHPLLLRPWMRVERTLPVLFPGQTGEEKRSPVKTQAD